MTGTGLGWCSGAWQGCASERGAGWDAEQEGVWKWGLGEGEVVVEGLFADGMLSPGPNGRVGRAVRTI